MHCVRFRNIALIRRSRMRIDVADVSGRQARIVQRELHRDFHRLRVRVCRMIAV
jgi:hypothetical protein